MNTSLLLKSAGLIAASVAMGVAFLVPFFHGESVGFNVGLAEAFFLLVSSQVASGILAGAVSGCMRMPWYHAAWVAVLAAAAVISTNLWYGHSDGMIAGTFGTVDGISESLLIFMLAAVVAFLSVRGARRLLADHRSGIISQ